MRPNTLYLGQQFLAAAIAMFILKAWAIVAYPKWYFPIFVAATVISALKANLVLVVCHVSLWFLRDPTPGSAGVFTCYHRIVQVTLTGLECKGIRDWLLSLWVDTGLSMAWVLSAEGMQSDLRPLDVEIQLMHQDSLNTSLLHS